MDKKQTDQLELDLSKNPHHRSKLLFLKYFKEGYKYLFSLYDIDKSVRSEMLSYLNTKYTLTIISREDYSGYDNYNQEQENKLSEREMSNFSTFDDMEYYVSNRISSDNIFLIDQQKKILVKTDYDSFSILSLNTIPDDIKMDMQSIQFKGFDITKDTSVHILSRNNMDGMYLEDFKIDDKYIDLDIDLNYNDGFKDVYESIIDNLEQNSIGLYFFHGEAGTGKTTLIRHLIRKTSKKIIFITPSMADSFASPDMIPFLMKYPNSIIIIEDSENIIKTRESGGNQSVSNLLNLSDGILGDCLKFQIICTFNTDKSQIDSALLRKGRLIESYEFGKLDVEKSNNLLKKLGKKYVTDKPMVLSDIYNFEENNHFNTSKKTIGFRTNKK